MVRTNNVLQVNQVAVVSMCAFAWMPVIPEIIVGITS